jgi:hypothetical protein
MHSKRKPIKIDWDEVEAAFDSPSEETQAYLDLVTGNLVLDGEGEGDPFEDEDDNDVERNAVDPPREMRRDPTRLYVTPPSLDERIDWLRSFLDSGAKLNGGVAEGLRRALDADDPIAEVAGVLRDHADERESWFLFRSERLHELIDEWLEDNEVQVIEPPPWQS